MLELLGAKSRNCTACELATNRTHVVFGEGNFSARILVVSDSPSEDDDLAARPFSGHLGRLLDKIFESGGIPRESVYTTLISKCFNPEESEPEVQSRTCADLWLEREIETLNPSIIIPLGAAATQYFTGEKKPISQTRGVKTEHNGRSLFPMFHPKYLLKSPSREAGSPKDLTWKDIQEVRKMLDLLDPLEVAEEQVATQDSLF